MRPGPVPDQKAALSCTRIKEGLAGAGRSSTAAADLSNTLYGRVVFQLLDSCYPGGLPAIIAGFHLVEQGQDWHSYSGSWFDPQFAGDHPQRGFDAHFPRNCAGTLSSDTAINLADLVPPWQEQKYTAPRRKYPAALAIRLHSRAGMVPNDLGIKPRGPIDRLGRFLAPGN